MASLVRRERLAGKAQMIYIDKRLAIFHDIWRIRNGMADFSVRNAPAQFGLTKYRGKKDAN